MLLCRTCLIFAKIKLGHNPVTHVSGQYIRKRNPENIANLRDALISTDWSDVITDQDIDDSYDKFLAKFSKLYNEYIPLCKGSRNKRKKMPLMPWITSSLLRSIKKKNKLYCHYKRNQLPHLYEKYSKYRNILTSSLRTAKKKYYSDQFNATMKNTQATWKVIRNVLKPTQKRSGIQNVKVNGVLVEDKLIMAENFNEYFSNIGSNLSKAIPECSKSFNDFLKEPNQKTIFFGPTNPDEIFAIVGSLKSKKSPGHDQITNELIKNVLEGIMQPLIHIFNLSMAKGIVPMNMKIAKVVPIFKKGDPQLLSNYRPISLLTTFSKILEKLIFSRTPIFF